MTDKNQDLVQSAIVYCGSITALAAKLGVSRGTIYDWINKRTRPRLAHYYKLESIAAKAVTDEK